MNRTIAKEWIENKIGNVHDNPNIDNDVVAEMMNEFTRHTIEQAVKNEKKRWEYDPNRQYVFYSLKRLTMIIEKENTDDHHGGYSLPARRYVKGASTNFCEDPNNDYAENTDDLDEKTSMLPCPFCGGQAEVKPSWLNRKENKFNSFYPSCKGENNDMCPGVIWEQDEQGGTHCDCKTPEEAIALWNRRPT